MANIEGALRTGISDAARVSNTSAGFVCGAWAARVQVTEPSIWKNQGWYAAGSVYEVWVTTSAPTTYPPSGHTLTHIQHQRVG